jgi:hypothetical protein
MIQLAGMLQPFGRISQANMAARMILPRIMKLLVSVDGKQLDRQPNPYYLYSCSTSTYNYMLTNRCFSRLSGHVGGHCFDINLSEYYSLRYDYVNVRIVEEVTSECLFV